MNEAPKKPLGYFTRLGIVLKASWPLIPVILFAGIGTSKAFPVLIALGLYFVVVHWSTVRHRDTIKRELVHSSKKELIDMLEADRSALRDASAKINRLEAALKVYARMARTGDLEAGVLEQIALALMAYDSSPTPVRALATLEVLRQNLTKLRREIFNV